MSPNASTLFVSLFLLSQCLGSAQQSPSAAMLYQITNRWAQIPPAELKRAAETGHPDAQYYYFTTERDAAWRDSQIADALLWPTNRITQNHLLTSEERADIEKWNSQPEADARHSAQAGGRAAQLYLFKLDGDRAYQRATNSFKWLKSAADQACAPAEYELGMCYLGLTGWRLVTPDPVEGLKWIRLAAGRGFEGAQHRIGDLLLEGGLLPVDLPEAIRYLRLAVDQGCSRAQFELAQQYGCGNGEPRSSDETPLALLNKSARAGWPEARYSLGERYRLGLSVTPNRARAFFWYSAAADEDFTPAAQQRDRLKPLLTAVDFQLLKQWNAKLERWPD
jgi:TPR repeat protein